MSSYYQLTYSGLVSALSSSKIDARRLMMLQSLANADHQKTTVNQIAECSGIDQLEATSLADSLLEDGYLSLVSDNNAVDQKVITKSDEFASHLETLSVNGKVILADAHGLILASSGYSQSDSEYIAAIATNLVQISEQARVRIKNQKDRNLWTTGLSWGRFRALCMSIYIGCRQYILVVGGLPDLEKIEFFDVVGFLVRRYGYE